MTFEVKFQAIVRRLTVDVAQLIEQERARLAQLIAQALTGQDLAILGGALLEPTGGAEPPPPVPVEPEAPTRASRATRPSRELLARTLEHHKGNVSRTAKALGVTRGAVHRWITEYDLSPKEHRTISRDELVAQVERHHGNVSQVAKALGHTRGHAHRLLKGFGLVAEDFRTTRDSGGEAGHPIDSSIDRDELVAQLERHHGNITHVAKAIDISREHTYRLLKALGLVAEDFRTTHDRGRGADHQADSSK